MILRKVQKLKENTEVSRVINAIEEGNLELAEQTALNPLFIS